MPTFLMATDLSARSDRAIERALILARDREAKLYVVHVVDEALPEAMALHQKAAAEDTIAKHIAGLQPGEEVAVSVESKFGKNGEAILQSAHELKADLVILGERDRAYERRFRGTSCERILRMGDVPVLVVRDRPDRSYRRVAVAVDFSLHSRRALEVAVRLVPDAEVHLVHAYQVPFSGFMYGSDTRRQVKEQEQNRLENMVENEMGALCEALGVDAGKFHRVLRLGDVRQVVRQEVERIKPDLLALGTHGRTGIANALLGSVAEDVLRDPPCDVLAVKAW